MKRKWFLAGAAALVLSGAAMNINVTKSNGGSNDILLANVQALASPEPDNFNGQHGCNYGHPWVEIGAWLRWCYSCEMETFSSISGQGRCN